MNNKQQDNRNRYITEQDREANKIDEEQRIIQ